MIDQFNAMLSWRSLLKALTSSRNVKYVGAENMNIVYETINI